MHLNIGYMHVIVELAKFLQIEYLLVVNYKEGLTIGEFILMRINNII